jgi:superfamily II DNA or RNA helicase
MFLFQARGGKGEVLSDYLEFIAGKDRSTIFNRIPEEWMPDAAFDYQKTIIRWALRKGRACIFAGTGLGKTLMELAWAENVQRFSKWRVLVLAPLAVSDQIVAEGERFGVKVKKIRTESDIDGPGVYVTNYAKLHMVKGHEWCGIVLDESSIIKHHDGATKAELIEFADGIEYRLASTATPAPNDWMELASHAEFLGVCSRAEMLSTYFVHDGGETQKWRLKGHAVTPFWKWVCSWGALLQSPEDIGFDGSRHKLPELRQHLASITSNSLLPGELFVVEAATLQERLAAKRKTVDERVAETARVVASHPDEVWVVWCHLNSESDALAESIPGSVELRGDQDEATKERILREFAEGKIRVLIGKPSMCGFGLNWQHCSKMIFVGLNDSWEQIYQAIRRCWRFGQKRPVDVWFVAADIEGNVVANIERKDKQAKEMADRMIAETSVFVTDELKDGRNIQVEYKREVKTGQGWEMRLGDCVDETAGMADGSIDFSIYSPPFASLYTYSASPRDMGNTRSDEEFFEQYRFLVRNLYRVTKPGRLTAFHCMLLPSSKTHHGEIGLRDFRGELIRIHNEEGWIYHSEVCIWKDPVTAMQRTKAIGLLWKQLKKDSTISRQGIPDYLVVCRKPGVNTSPVSHTPEEFPVGEWQKIASPVWMDINPSDTLQKTSAREEEDERHICPLQLEVIRRALRMWSNEGDTVLSPFGGIGSEGHVSLQMGRKFIGCELKESYWKQACANLAAARSNTASLFSNAAV